MVYAQSEILQKEVFLFELIENSGQKVLKNLNAICFLRPTEENIELLERELHEPKYGGYYICKIFTYLLNIKMNKTCLIKILVILLNQYILKS